MGQWGSALKPVVVHVRDTWQASERVVSIVLEAGKNFRLVVLISAAGRVGWFGGINELFQIMRGQGCSVCQPASNHESHIGWAGRLYTLVRHCLV